MVMSLKTDRPLDDFEDSLFDDTRGYDDETGVRFAPGLTDRERKQAVILYRLFNELWGICAVFGDPGFGKDVFGNYLAYTLKRYFPHKRILRDEKPRRLFGHYDGLFNEEVLQDDLLKMRQIARGSRKEVDGQRFDGTYMEALERAADDWVTDKGEVLLHNSVLYLTEYWRYCYNREPHNPMNKTMGGIHKQKRHLDVLIIGTAQLVSELDKKTCKPWIDWRVTCTRSKVDTTRYTYFVERVKYDRRLDVLNSISRPYAIPVDAGKPRSFIGDGKIRLTKRASYYLPESEEERIVLDVLKAGVDNYEQLVEFITTEGDMSEWEISLVLKELCLKLPHQRQPKYVIDYPCYYKIFNSKSAPNMKTKVRLEE